MLKWILPVLGAAIVIGGVVMVRQARSNAGQAARLAQLAAENRELRARAVPAPAPAPAAPGQPPAASRAAPPAETRIVPAPSEPTGGEMQQLREKLAQSAAATSQLESRIGELDAQVQKLSLDNKRLAASEADLNENLSAANRAIDAVQRELKAKSDRLVQAETEIARLREEANTDRRKVADTIKLVSDLQGLQRRRETYVSNLLRRYRDLTDQYRAVAGVIESRRQSEGGAIGGADLSRIQSTIAMAEEDLRQLNSLNAQAVALQRKLSAATP